jgi:DNA polymerase I
VGPLPFSQLNYGMKEKKLARDLGCTVEEAVTLIAAYLKRYPAVARFYEESVSSAIEMGCRAYTILGRRRHLTGLTSPDTGIRWAAQRRAANTEIQGGAADVVRMAMINVDAMNLEASHGLILRLQVHDELVMTCPKETEEDAMRWVRLAMEHPFETDLAVPLPIEAGKARNWGDAK